MLNAANGSYALIGGGLSNVASGNSSFVGAGTNNSASAEMSVVAGGHANSAAGRFSSVLGGLSNKASANFSVLIGGKENTASGVFASVAGGFGNEANGTSSFIGGGILNTVVGDDSVAFGSFSRVLHDSSAVFSFSEYTFGDHDHEGGYCDSVGNNTVTICADNGLFVNGAEVAMLRDLSVFENGLRWLDGNTTMLLDKVADVYVMANVSASLARELEFRHDELAGNITSMYSTQLQLHNATDVLTLTVASLESAVSALVGNHSEQVALLEALDDIASDHAIEYLQLIRNHSALQEVVSHLSNSTTVSVAELWGRIGELINNDTSIAFSVADVSSSLDAWVQLLLTNDTSLQDQIDDLLATSSSFALSAAVSDAFDELVTNDTVLAGTIAGVSSVAKDLGVSVASLESAVSALVGNHSEQVALLEALDDIASDHAIEYLQLIRNHSALQEVVSHLSNSTTVSVAELWGRIGELINNDTSIAFSVADVSSSLDAWVQLLLTNDTSLQDQIDDLLATSSSFALSAAVSDAFDELVTNDTVLAGTIAGVSSVAKDLGVSVASLESAVSALVGNHSEQVALLEALDDIASDHAIEYLQLIRNHSALQEVVSRLSNSTTVSVAELWGRIGELINNDTSIASSVADVSSSLDAWVQLLLTNDTSLQDQIDDLLATSSSFALSAAVSDAFDELVTNDTVLAGTIAGVSSVAKDLGVSVASLESAVSALVGNHSEQVALLEALDDIASDHAIEYLQLIRNHSALQEVVSHLSNSTTVSVAELWGRIGELINNDTSIASSVADVSSSLDAWVQLLLTNDTSLQDQIDDLLATSSSFALSAAVSDAFDELVTNDTVLAGTIAGVSSVAKDLGVSVASLESAVSALVGNHSEQVALLEALDDIASDHAIEYLQLIRNHSALQEVVSHLSNSTTVSVAELWGRIGELINNDTSIASSVADVSSSLDAWVQLLLTNDTSLQDQIDDLLATSSSFALSAAVSDAFDELVTNDTVLAGTIAGVSSVAKDLGVSVASLESAVSALVGNHSEQVALLEALDDIASDHAIEYLQLIRNHSALQEVVSHLSNSTTVSVAELWGRIGELINNDTSIAFSVADVSSSLDAWVQLLLTNDTSLQDQIDDLLATSSSFALSAAVSDAFDELVTNDTVLAGTIAGVSSVAKDLGVSVASLESAVSALVGNHSEQVALLEALDDIASDHAIEYLQLIRNHSALQEVVSHLSNSTTVSVAELWGRIGELINNDTSIAFSVADVSSSLDAWVQLLLTNDTSLQDQIDDLLATSSSFALSAAVSDAFDELVTNDTVLAGTIAGVSSVAKDLGVSVASLESAVSALVGNHSEQVALLEALDDIASDHAIEYLQLIRNHSALQEVVSHLSNSTTVSVAELWGRIGELINNDTSIAFSVADVSSSLDAWVQLLLTNDSSLQDQIDDLLATSSSFALSAAVSDAFDELVTNDTVLAGAIAGVSSVAKDLGVSVASLESAVSALVGNHSEQVALLEALDDIASDHAIEYLQLIRNHSALQEVVSHLSNSTTVSVAELWGRIGELINNDTSIASSVADVSSSLDAWVQLLLTNDTSLQDQIDDLLATSSSFALSAAVSDAFDELVTNDTVLAGTIAGVSSVAKDLGVSVASLESAVSALVGNHSEQVALLEALDDIASDHAIEYLQLIRNHSALQEVVSRLSNSTTVSVAELWGRIGELINNDTSIASSVADVSSSLDAWVQLLLTNDTVLETSLLTLSTDQATVRAEVALNAAAIDSLTVSFEHGHTILQSQLDALVHRIDGCGCHNHSNETAVIRAQQETIASLEHQVHLLNDNVTSLAAAVSSLLQASTFAPQPTTDVSDDVIPTVNGCTESSIAPCSSAPAPSVSLTTTSSEDEPTLDVDVAVCYSYACVEEPQVGALAWNRPLLFKATVHNSAAAVTSVPTFHWSLTSSTSSSEVWSDSTSTQFATFTAKDEGLPVSETYKLMLDVRVDQHVVARASIVNVSFSTPPILHSITLQPLSRSAALHSFDVAVNASSTTSGGLPLQYTYNLVSYPREEWVYEAVAETEQSRAAFASASTRAFFLQVTVTDALGSFVECVLGNSTKTDIVDTVMCPFNNDTSTVVEVGDVVDEIISMLHNNDTNATVMGSAFLAGLDVASSNATTDVETFLELFEQYLDTTSGGGGGDIDVLVLQLFFGLATAGQNDEIGHDFTADLLHVIEVVGEEVASHNGHSSTLDAFVDVVQSFADLNDHDRVLALLDESLEAVCLASSSNNAPLDMPRSFVEQAFSVNCVFVETSGNGFFLSTTETSVVAAPGFGAASLTVTQWPRNTSNATGLVADLFGVSLSHYEHAISDTQTNDVDAGYEISMQISNTETGIALRKALSCSFFDMDLEQWSSRGVVLRGLDVHAEERGTSAISVVALCVSSHLTLFTLEDDSEAAQILETRVNDFTGRFDTLSQVDLLAGDATLNLLFPIIFAVMTGGLVTVVIVSSLRGRKQALAGAQRVFTKFGALSKPSVIGGKEYEALLRRDLTARQAIWMFLLDMSTSNAFLSLFFTWSHEAIVFTKAHQTFILYAAILSTFLVQAFFFELDSGGGDVDTPLSFWGQVLDVAVSSLMAKLFVFPVEYFLPYMISNVNSFSTSTSMPKSIVRKQMEKLLFRIVGDGGRKKIKQKLAPMDNNTFKESVAQFMAQTSTARGVRRRVHSELSAQVGVVPVSDSEKQNQFDGPSTHSVDKSLRFMMWHLKLPDVHLFHLEKKSVEKDEIKFVHHAERVADEQVLAKISRLQKRYRQFLLERQKAREVEFSSWYTDCRSERHALTLINYLFLGILGAFTFVVCLLVSAAFTDTECALWVVSVVENIAMQIFVIDVLIGGGVVMSKLVGSSVLLAMDRKSRIKERKMHLLRKEDSLLSHRYRVEESLRSVETELQSWSTTKCVDGESGAATIIAAENMVEKEAAKLRLRKRLARIDTSLERVAAQKTAMALDPSASASQQATLAAKAVASTNAIKSFMDNKETMNVKSTQQRRPNDSDHAVLIHDGAVAVTGSAVVANGAGAASVPGKISEDNSDMNILSAERRMHKLAKSLSKADLEIGTRRGLGNAKTMGNGGKMHGQPAHTQLAIAPPALTQAPKKSAVVPVSSSRKPAERRQRKGRPFGIATAAQLVASPTTANGKLVSRTRLLVEDSARKKTETDGAHEREPIVAKLQRDLAAHRRLRVSDGQQRVRARRRDRRKKAEDRERARGEKIARVSARKPKFKVRLSDTRDVSQSKSSPAAASVAQFDSHHRREIESIEGKFRVSGQFQTEVSQKKKSVSSRQAKKIRNVSSAASRLRGAAAASSRGEERAVYRGLRPVSASAVPAAGTGVAVDNDQPKGFPMMLNQPSLTTQFAPPNTTTM